MQHLLSGSGLFDDHTGCIQYSFLVADSTMGFFAPEASQRDSVRLVKTHGSFMDKAYESVFDQTFGQLKIAEYAQDHFHSMNFILEVDFSLDPLEISPKSTLATIESKIVDVVDDSIHSLLERYPEDFPGDEIKEGARRGELLKRLLVS